MIFLRHPTPDIDRSICYGRTDMDIAEEGHAQIEQALEATPRVRYVFASPALRCRKLAESLARRDSAWLEFDERLWEMHMGDWEGIPWKSIDRAVSEVWLVDPVNIPTPNGECFADLQKRVAHFVEEIRSDGIVGPGEAAIVCHAGPIRAMQMAVNAISFKTAFEENPVYASPIHLDVFG